MTIAERKIRRSVGTAIGRYGLIKANDRIMVALSGGKDSWVLIHILSLLQRCSPVKFQLISATFNPGFPEFGLSEIQNYCAQQGWEHHCVKLDLPAIITQKHWENNPCVLCSRLRRGKLYGLANQLNCNKLALGQHLDDLAVSFAMSVFRGKGVYTMAPLVHPDEPEAPVIIRPLALTAKADIISWAKELAVPIAGKCNYYQQLQQGDRAEFERWLGELDKRIPNWRNNFASSLTEIRSEHLLIPPGNMP